MGLGGRSGIPRRSRPPSLMIGLVEHERSWFEGCCGLRLATNHLLISFYTDCVATSWHVLKPGGCQGLFDHNHGRPYVDR